MGSQLFYICKDCFTLLDYLFSTFIIFVFIKDKKSEIVVEGKENDIIQYKGNLFFYVFLFTIALGTVFKLIPYYILMLLVFIVVFFIQRKVLYKIDYALLFTFIGFFIFTGNIGGLGTLIASMASLISYKLYTHKSNSTKGKYLLYFTIVNIIFLVALLLVRLI